MPVDYARAAGDFALSGQFASFCGELIDQLDNVEVKNITPPEPKLHKRLHRP